MNKKIIESAKRIHLTIEDGYTYNDKVNKMVPDYINKITDCSHYVSWVLYDMGLKQFKGKQLSSINFFRNSIRDGLGVYESTNTKNLKIGDILVYDGHVEIFDTLYFENEYKYLVYNAGSNEYISKSAPRESSHSINQIKKILRII